MVQSRDWLLVTQTVLKIGNHTRIISQLLTGPSSMVCMYILYNDYICNTFSQSTVSPQPSIQLPCLGDLALDPIHPYSLLVLPPLIIPSSEYYKNIIYSILF